MRSAGTVTPPRAEPGSAIDGGNRTHPVIVLVEPQLPENIGMAARAMANFGLRQLRLVNPRAGWPNPASRGPAAGALAVLDAARVFASTREAIADLQTVFATTARARDQMKRVLALEEAIDLFQRRPQGAAPGILFGPERSGLDNDDISLADAIITFPVDPAFASLNLAQAVLLVGYEWARAARVAEPLPFGAGPVTPPATRQAVLSLFDHIEAELDVAGHYPPEKRDVMIRNMRDMFHRMDMSEQDVRTWRGAIRALSVRRLKA